MNLVNRFWNSAEQAMGKPTLYILTAIILLRLVTLGLYPLMDTTEGRYGEMVRKMAEMNDWITPWFDVGVPFWGKPPLAFWMSALGIKAFGVNEFAVRFPQFLGAVLVAAICFDWAKRAHVNPFFAVTTLITSVLFAVLSGAVTTDMALCIGATLSLRGFWLALRGEASRRTVEQWLFFIGLGIMLLAKGPVGWVLVLMPIGLWAVLTGSIRETWRGLAWIVGGIAAILMALPWYLIAEQHSPGFLHYFIVGEHWERFTVTGWKGDLYGSAHAKPHGYIWLLFIAASLPWCFIFPITLWLKKRFPSNTSLSNNRHPSFKLFLILAGLSPCLFFTMSGNVLWTYLLPGLPALAILLALMLSEIKDNIAKRVVLIGTLISGIVILMFFFDILFDQRADAKSAKAVVQLYEAQRSETPLVFLDDRGFSSKFYTKGKSVGIQSLAELNTFPPDNDVYVAVSASDVAPLQQQLKSLEMIGDGVAYRLYLKRAVP